MLYWPREVTWRAKLSMVSQVAWQVWDIRHFAVDSGSWRRVMLTSLKAILALLSMTSFPLMLVWEEIHWRVISHLLLVRCRRVC